MQMPCGHLSVTDTLLLQAGAKSLAKNTDRERTIIIYHHCRCLLLWTPSDGLKGVCCYKN